VRSLQYILDSLRTFTWRSLNITQDQLKTADISQPLQYCENVTKIAFGDVSGPVFLESRSLQLSDDPSKVYYAQELTDFKFEDSIRKLPLENRLY
jgi:hypothetical protein